MRMNFYINTKLEKGEYTERLKEVLWESMLKMQELAVMYAPVNTGNLRERINLSPMSRGAVEYTLSDGVDYGIHLEYGTGPHWVPIKPLKEWSRLVLGDESAAYAVRQKIKNEGTPAQPYFRPSLHQTKEIWMPFYYQKLMSRP